MKISASRISARGVYFGLGVFSVALLGAMGHVMLIGARVGDTYVPLVRAAEEIKLDATLAHLWFEEILSGDRHESMDQVWNGLESARFYARAMVQGAEDGEGVIVPLEDPELRDSIRNVERKLDEFESITGERQRARPSSGSGTEIDQAYDAVFGELIALTDDVERELYRAIRRDTRSLRRAQVGVIAGVLLLAILVAVIFFHYMKQREQAERTLRSKVRAEAEAREHLEQLSHVVRLSTMSEFAAGIAHEVNQPLAAIAAAAGACRRLPGPRQREALELIESEALRASDVIRRMRAFVAKRESHYRLVDVNGVVRRTIELADFDPQMRQTNIRLKLAADLPPAEADEIQIQQVLLNLVRNGCEAAQGVDSGKADVTVQTRVTDGSNIEVSVCDQGAGVPDEVASDPFRPFVTTKDSGMGMGLSITKSIIDAHGGRIWFHRNEQVDGTTFRFTLPVAGKESP